MGIGPVPEPREDGGVIEGRCHGEPAELPGEFGEREVLAGKGDEAGGDFHRRGDNKTGNKKLDKKRKINTGERERRLLLFLRSGILSQFGWSRERGDEEYKQIFF